MKEKHLERLKEFFSVYPNESECILFSDGQIFTKKNTGYAKQFENQSGLKNEIVTRVEFEGIISGDNSDTENSEQKNLKDLTKKELVALGETLGLTLELKSPKPELVAAVEEAQKNVQSSEGQSEDDDSEEDYKPVNTESDGN